MTRYDRQTRPRLTVGLPVYNGERYLAQALDSILVQTCDDLEIVISDNASTDDTQKICAYYLAKDPRLSYHNQPENLGAAYNFNFVFARARGEFFKWVAYDDLMAPTFLEKCLDILEREPDVVLAYPQTVNVDEVGRVIGHYADDLNLIQVSAPQRLQKFLATPGLCHPVFGLFRTEILRQTSLIGNYPRSDRNLIGEISLWGKIAEIQEPLFYRRHHPLTSTNANKTESELATWFDPKAQGRLVFPRARRFVEYFRSIHHSPLTMKDKIACYAHVCRYMLYPRRWLGIGDDVQTAARKSLLLAAGNRSTQL
jgi:glycosyltransferase involved in cell wall biosynthesis